MDPIKADARTTYYPAHPDNRHGSRSHSEVETLVRHNTVSEDFTAAAIAHWFQNPAAGSVQEIVDSERTERSVGDLEICEGARGGDAYWSANRNGWHLEYCSQPTWSPAKWLRDHYRMMKRGAYREALICFKYRIKPRWLTVARLRAGERGGITSHRNISKAFNVSGGHTDPGAPVKQPRHPKRDGNKGKLITLGLTRFYLRQLRRKSGRMWA